MSGAVGLAVILLGMAAIVFFDGQGDIAGLPAEEFASLLALGALVLLIVSSVVQEFRGKWMRGVQALALWALLIVGVTGLYEYRGELRQVANRLMSDMAPGEPAVGSGG